eukprot:1194666-Prorocentrum_minimum.AAC.4
MFSSRPAYIRPTSHLSCIQPQKLKLREVSAVRRPNACAPSSVILAQYERLRKVSVSRAPVPSAVAPASDSLPQAARLSDLRLDRALIVRIPSSQLRSSEVSEVNVRHWPPSACAPSSVILEQLVRLREVNLERLPIALTPASVTLEQLVRFREVSAVRRVESARTIASVTSRHQVQSGERREARQQVVKHVVPRALRHLQLHEESVMAVAPLFAHESESAPCPSLATRVGYRRNIFGASQRRQHLVMHIHWQELPPAGAVYHPPQRPRGIQRLRMPLCFGPCQKQPLCSALASKQKDTRLENMP